MGADFWGPVNFNELTTSVGLVPLVALPLALALAWRRAGVRFFLAAAALAAVVVFGVPVAGPFLAEVAPLSMAIPTRMASVLACTTRVKRGT